MKIGRNNEYEHHTNLSPTKKLLNDYKSNLINWEKFEVIFRNMLKERNAIKQLDLKNLDHVCFLCSENMPTYCHRRLVVEEIKNAIDCEIVHL